VPNAKLGGADIPVCQKVEQTFLSAILLPLREEPTRPAVRPRGGGVKNTRNGSEAGTVAKRYCNARIEMKLTQHLVDATSVGLGNNNHLVTMNNIDDCRALARFWQGTH
jgi:hypothetical protein